MSQKFNSPETHTLSGLTQRLFYRQTRQEMHNLRLKYNRIRKSRQPDSNLISVNLQVTVLIDIFLIEILFKQSLKKPLQRIKHDNSQISPQGYPQI
ncbi:hypothetical protein [Pseudidiomarina indica]|uniref:hypothetical protein n=1 Tax=Pseudidiomarina indica TaxID=1159017 RepID=UPI00115F95C1|nr:hypothetical protein [Pseudidiomarina indica]